MGEDFELDNADTITTDVITSFGYRHWMRRARRWRCQDERAKRHESLTMRQMGKILRRLHGIKDGHWSLGRHHHSFGPFGSMVKSKGV